MRRSLTIFIFAVLALIPSQVVAQAQNSSGLWFGLGVGGGWGRIGCDLCVADRQLGYTGLVSFGGTIRDGLLVGAEVGGWRFQQDEVRQSIGMLAGVMTLYPRPDQSGLFVKGGLGVNFAQVTEGEGDVGATTVGVQLGLGHEFKLTPGWSLMNSVNVMASSFGTLKEGNETIVGDVSNTVLRFTVAVKKH
ncbi:MAG: outer membrane beta-barrel protein [Longimicrobiales bacterium]